MSDRINRSREWRAVNALRERNDALTTQIIRWQLKYEAVAAELDALRQQLAKARRARFPAPIDPDTSDPVT